MLIFHGIAVIAVCISVKNISVSTGLSLHTIATYVCSQRDNRDGLRLVMGVLYRVLDFPG